MITGVVIGVLLTIAALMGRRALRAADAKGRTVAIAAFLCLLVIGVAGKVYVDRRAQPTDALHIVQSVSPAAWLQGDPPRGNRPSSANPEGAMQVAPIPSLLTGLEARLAANPGDPDGWALLAQSYAYVGKADETEHALARAVALGADEQTLRQRVNSARREPHPAGSWIEQAIRD